MRNNQPVSGREYPFPQGKTVISYTNLKGQITRANDAFIDLSGFTKAELMDQPHNLVRHPDMPPEAFRELLNHLENQNNFDPIFLERLLGKLSFWKHVDPSSDYVKKAINSVNKLRKSELDKPLWGVR